MGNNLTHLDIYTYVRTLKEFSNFMQSLFFHSPNSYG